MKITQTTPLLLNLALPFAHVVRGFIEDARGNRYVLVERDDSDLCPFAVYSVSYETGPRGHSCYWGHYFCDEAEARQYFASCIVPVVTLERRVVCQNTIVGVSS